MSRYLAPGKYTHVDTKSPNLLTPLYLYLDMWSWRELQSEKTVVCPGSVGPAAADCFIHPGQFYEH